MTRSDVRILQEKLNSLGYPVDVDGIYGPETRAAHQDYLDAHNAFPEIYQAPPAAKPWWTSKATIGWVLTILFAILSRFIDTDLKADDWTPAVVQVLEGLSAMLGVYGNATREAPIDPTLVLPRVRIPSRRARQPAGTLDDQPDDQRVYVPEPQARSAEHSRSRRVGPFEEPFWVDDDSGGDS